MNRVTKAVKMNGREYNFNYPSAFRANELQRLLDIDIIQDAQKYSQNPQLFTRALDTAEKTKEALQVIMGDQVTDEMVETFSPFDLATIFTLFFSEMMVPKVSFNSELRRLEDIANQLMTKVPEATPSTS